MTPDISRARRPFVMEDAVALLARTPATLNTLLRDLPDGWLTATEGDATWSPFDVVGHLLHGERADWMPRVRLILESGESRAFDRVNRTAQFSASAGRTMAELLDDFATARRESLRELTALGVTAIDLDRRGRHPEFGVVTLRQLLSTWVAHDLDHLVQVSRVLARQYSDEVGPWRAYLRVIRQTDV